MVRQMILKKEKLYKKIVFKKITNYIKFVIFFDFFKDLRSKIYFEVKEMDEIKEYTEKLFDDIKHVDENGNEYWYARELMTVLEYSLWQRFSNVIKKAMENCENSNYNVSDHFIGADKMVNIGSNTMRNISDLLFNSFKL